MSKVREYKTTHVIELPEVGRITAGTLISKETFDKLGNWKLEVQVTEREFPDELLSEELSLRPHLEVVAAKTGCQQGTGSVVSYQYKEPPVDTPLPEPVPESVAPQSSAEPTTEDAEQKASNSKKNRE